MNFGMIATGNHVDFDSLRGAPPPLQTLCRGRRLRRPVPGCKFVPPHGDADCYGALCLAMTEENWNVIPRERSDRGNPFPLRYRTGQREAQ